LSPNQVTDPGRDEALILISLKIKNHCKKQRILEVLFYLDYRSIATLSVIYPVLVKGYKL